MVDNLSQALVYHKQGNLDKAKKIYHNLLKLNPENFEIINLLGVLNFQQKNFYASIDLFNQALSIEHHHAVYNNLANVYKEIKKYDDAILNYKKAIRLNINYAEAYNNLGITFKEIKNEKEAEKNYQKAIELKPNYAEAYNNIGILYGELLCNYEKAILNLKNAIKLNPYYAEAYNHLGVFYFKSGEFKNSILSLNKAIEINPNYIDAYLNRANVYNEQNGFILAVEDCNKLKKIDPDNIHIYETLSFIINNKIGRWKNFEKNLDSLKKNLIKYKSFGEAITPFALLNIIDSMEIIKNYTKNHINDELRSEYIIRKKSSHTNKKIRIGYFSPDFRNHAVSFLAKDIFKYHDKKKFEIIGFDLSNYSSDRMTAEISSYFDNFVDYKGLSDRDLILKARELKLDIAVDLCGLTKNNRVNIFLNRVAPLQINFLGYPGSIGDFFEYIIADKTLIPEENRKFYFEKIIYMPHTYQPYSVELENLNLFSNRKKYLIPEDKFIYCCLNSSQKINPLIFNSWLNILEGTKDSSLCILDSNLYFKENLLNLIAKRNLNKNRLIFTPFIDQKFVFERNKHFNLFLDTFPYGGHTTTREALISGLPVITIAGQSFQSRVSSSLLASLDMNELIKFNIKDYENFAITLGNDNKKYNEVKKKLSEMLLNTKAFNIEIFTKNLEFAYEKIFAHNKLNLPPKDFYIN